MSARSRAHPWFRTAEDFERLCAAWSAAQPYNQAIRKGAPHMGEWTIMTQLGPCPCGAPDCPRRPEHFELEETFGGNIDLWAGGGPRVYCMACIEEAFGRPPTGPHVCPEHRA